MFWTIGYVPLPSRIRHPWKHVNKALKIGTVTKVPHKIGDFATKGTALMEFADEE